MWFIGSHLPFGENRKNRFPSLALDAWPLTPFLKWNHTKTNPNPPSPRILSCPPTWSRPGPEAADPTQGLIFVPVLCSGSACQTPSDNPDYPPAGLFFWRKRKKNKVHREGKQMTNSHLAVSRRHAALATRLILTHKSITRWSEGSRRLLVLAKQLGDCPRWLSCRRARSAFYDCEKAPIEPG